MDQYKYWSSQICLTVLVFIITFQLYLYSNKYFLYYLITLLVKQLFFNIKNFIYYK